MRQMEDLTFLLKNWPELEPDPKAVECLTERVVQRMRRLKEQEKASAQAAQFQLLCWGWAVLAIGIYLLRPRLALLLAAYPLLLVVLAGFGAAALLAPLLLIPLLRSSHGAKKLNTVL